METVKLPATTRDLKVSAKALRGQKIIPAVYYGKKEKSQHLSMDYQTFRKAFIKAGTSQVIELSIDGHKDTHVLVHDVQYEPLSGKISHVDFLHVNLKEAVTTHVKVVPTGVAPAVKDLGGILTTVKHELKIKCLPMEIPHEIMVDVSGLDTFAKAVHVKDVVVPKGVTILDHAEDVVFTVSAVKVVVEEAAPAAASAIAGTALEDAAKAAAEAEAAKKGDKKE